MSPQISAIVGVVVGALLAGAGNLLLAWRDETIQARAGVVLIRKVLREALAELGRLRGEPEPRWSPERLPDGKLWDQYREAVSARLSLATLRKIDIAMRELDQLNGSAERAAGLRAAREQLAREALVRGNDEGAEKLLSAPSPEILEPEVYASLETIEGDLIEALKAVDRVSPSGGDGTTEHPHAFKPWFRWHWRSFAAVAAMILLLAAAVGASTLHGTSTAARVQDAFDSHFDHAAFASCEGVHDHEGEYTCVVANNSPRSCGAAVAGRSKESRFVSARENGGTPVQKSCGIDRLLEYEARTQREDNCIAFYQTRKSNTPTKAPSSPGLPSAIVPASAFTADC